MFGNSRRGQTQEFDQLAYAQLPAPQCTEDSNPALISDCFGGPYQLSHG